MRKSIIYCDRCGRELQPSERSYMLTTFIYGEDRESASDVCDGAELCETCYEIIDKAVLAAIKDEKPEPKKSREPAITDLGKLKALLRASWKIKDIAIEFGCSEQTVRNTIKRLQDMDLGIEEANA